MQLIYQDDPNGCGIACVAMILNLSYEAARHLMFPDSKTIFGTSTPHIKDVLSEHGFEIRNLIPFRSRTPHSLAHDALLKVNPYMNGRRWHWILWDSDSKIIRDPERAPCTNYRFISYMPLIRLKTPAKN